jgi:hypothetical protein
MFELPTAPFILSFWLERSGERINAMCNYFALTSPALLSQYWARREFEPLSGSLLPRLVEGLGMRVNVGFIGFLEKSHIA